MNKELTEVVSELFYEDKLHSHESAHDRNLVLNDNNFRKKKYST